MYLFYFWLIPFYFNHYIIVIIIIIIVYLHIITRMKLMKSDAWSSSYSGDKSKPNNTKPTRSFTYLLLCLYISTYSYCINCTYLGLLTCLLLLTHHLVFFFGKIYYCIFHGCWISLNVFLNEQINIKRIYLCTFIYLHMTMQSVPLLLKNVVM